MTALDLLLNDFETFSNPYFVPRFAQVSKGKCYFKRPFLENQGYQTEMLDDGREKFVFNAVGVNEDDLNVEVKHSDFYGKQTLSVDGKTDNWEVHYNLIIPAMKDVEVSVKNGLVTLIVEYDKPVVDVNIRKSK